MTDDCSGGREALRLLVRLGDQEAAAFCGSAPEARRSATRAAHQSSQRGLAVTFVPLERRGP